METWPYTSPVTATEECPSSSETACVRAARLAALVRSGPGVACRKRSVESPGVVNQRAQDVGLGGVKGAGDGLELDARRASRVVATLTMVMFAIAMVPWSHSPSRASIRCKTLSRTFDNEGRTSG